MSDYNKKHRNKADEVAEELANKYIAAMEKGEIPWRKPWSTTGQVRNGTSNRCYRGINRFLLELISFERGYTDPRFYTYLDVQKHFKSEIEKNNSKLKEWKFIDAKGMGIDVLYFSYYNKETRKTINDAEYRELLKTKTKEWLKENITVFSKTTKVFNAKHIDGLEPLPPVIQSVVSVDTIQNEFLNNLIKNMNVKFSASKDATSAYYSPFEDSVTVPHKDKFDSYAAFLETALHELSHATGHEDRLNRSMLGFFGDENYAKEELRADIGSNMIMKELYPNGISTSLDENHLAYIQSWIKNLKDKPKELKDAIIDAQKILDYVEEKGEIKKYLQLSETYEKIKSSVYERLEIFQEDMNIESTDWFELDECVENVYESLEENVLLSDNNDSLILEEIDEEITKQYEFSKSSQYTI